MSDPTRPPGGEPMSREMVEQLLDRAALVVDELRPLVDHLGIPEVTSFVADAERALTAARMHVDPDVDPSTMPTYVFRDTPNTYNFGMSSSRPGFLAVEVSDDLVSFAVEARPAAMTALGLNLAAMAASHLADVEAES